jgi:hypothetical protein
MPQLQDKTAGALWTSVVVWCLLRSFFELKEIVDPSALVQSSQTYGVTSWFVRRPRRRLLLWVLLGTASLAVTGFVPEPTSDKTLCSGEYPDAVALWRLDGCLIWGRCGATPVSAKAGG